MNLGSRHKIWCSGCSIEIPYFAAIRDGETKLLVCKKCYTAPDRQARRYKPKHTGIDPTFISADVPERTTFSYVPRWGLAAPFKWGTHNVQNEVFWNNFTWGENE